MKVSNMTSNNGNSVPNQFIIQSDDGTIQQFQSYKTIIAHKCGDSLELDSGSWDYSKTTSKYRNQFTGLTTAQTKAGIADGSIILTDLN